MKLASGTEKRWEGAKEVLKKTSGSFFERGASTGNKLLHLSRSRTAFAHGRVESALADPEGIFGRKNPRRHPIPAKEKLADSCIPRCKEECSGKPSGGIKAHSVKLEKGRQSYSIRGT